MIPGVTAIAALSGPLPKFGVVVAAAFVAVTLLAGDDRVKAGAMLGALALAPVLLLADIWHSPQLRTVHRHPLFGLVAAALALAVVAAIAVVIARRPRLLAVYVVLYGVQAVYSPDFEKALQQMVFFYVPFALMFVLLRKLQWDRQLIRRCMELVAALAVLFAIVGFVEYATKTIVLNPRL